MAHNGLLQSGLSWKLMTDLNWACSKTLVRVVFPCTCMLLQFICTKPSSNPVNFASPGRCTVTIMSLMLVLPCLPGGANFTWFDRHPSLWAKLTLPAKFAYTNRPARQAQQPVYIIYSAYISHFIFLHISARSHTEIPTKLNTQPLRKWNMPRS